MSTLHIVARVASVATLSGLLFTVMLVQAEGDEKKWTAEQMEVWKTVQEYSAASQRRDLESYLSFFHPDFVGWLNGMDTTTDKDARSGMLAQYFAATSSPQMAIEPIAIRVFGNSAVVHYRITQTLHMADGTELPELEYWTDILVKDKGKWLLIADHGGSIEAEE